MESYLHDESMLHFRDEIRSFLDRSLPAEWRLTRLDHDLEEGQEPIRREWQRRLYEGGWLQMAWPTAMGGRDATPLMEAIFQTELAKAGAPPIWGRGGAYLLAPTLMHHGSLDQQERFVHDVLSGKTFFCQAFSEPNSGSDLASIQTRAVRVSDGWVLNGQKAWSSGAGHADRAFLLARTNLEERPHRSIGFFLVDLHQPGVTVRTTKQLTGEAEFGEIFLTDVMVEERDLVGAPDAGWKIAMTTFTYERAAIANAVFLERSVDELIGLATRAELGADPHVRQRLMQLLIEAKVFMLQSWRDVMRYERGHAPGAETSASKIAWTETARRVRSYAMDLHGLHGQVIAEDDTGSRTDGWRRLWLWSLAQTIYGGTSEVQRDIVAERLLGLPRVR